MSAEDPQSNRTKQIKSYLHEALSVSSQAVQADSMANSDPIRSHSLYKECAHRIELISPFLPDEYSAILGKFSKVYLERANRLRDQIMDQEIVDLPEKDDSKQVRSAKILEPPKGTTQFFINDTPTKIEFETLELPEFSHSTYQKVPTEWARRPYWLMRLLSTSMKKGAHVFPNLYIARDVWFQKKVPGKYLQHLHPKMMFCERIYIMLKELSLYQDLLFSDPNKESTYSFLGERLDDFMKRVEKENDLLSKTIQTSKSKKLFALGKIYSRVFSTSKKGTSTSSNEANAYDVAQNQHSGNSTQNMDNIPYIPVLSKLFDLSQYLDDWYVHVTNYHNSLPKNTSESLLRSVKNVKQLLESVGVFLYFRLCGFVLSDLHILLECYLRQMRDSFEYMS